MIVANKIEDYKIYCAGVDCGEWDWCLDVEGAYWCDDCYAIMLGGVTTSTNATESGVYYAMKISI